MGPAKKSNEPGGERIGRPVYEPSAKDRELVEGAAAVGILHEDIAKHLHISAPTLRKYFRHELDDGVFKASFKVGGGIYRLATESKDEKIRLDASKWWSDRRMGWKATTVQENVGKDGGPIEMRDVSARELIESRIAGIIARRREGGGSSGADD
jgi:hypothetical protein